LLGRLLSHPQRSAAALAILIGFTSLLSATLAWRASLASIEHSRYVSLIVEQQARIEELQRQHEGVVAQDERFLNAYQEDALAARQLQAQADSMRSSDPTTADQLDLEAQSRLALGRALEPFFQGANVTLQPDGTVAYDHAYVLRNIEQGDVELRELCTNNGLATGQPCAPQRTIDLAARAGRLVLNLTGVAAVTIAALFFLTIAQVSRARARLREVFFAGGASLVAVGTLAFLVVEIFA
jgi:hypothetical protein